jgi:hypothetical protein
MDGWLANGIVDWLAVAILGALAGATELIARYRDSPGRALATAPAILYVAINALASVAALGVVRVFGWEFGVSPDNPAQLRLTQALIAGFGALALFRTSLFTVRQGGDELSIGPSSVLKSILGASDRAVDRIRAQSRATVVARAMDGVSFDKAYQELPTVVLALMQNLSPDEQDAFAAQIAELKASNLSEHGKNLALGLPLLTLVGEGALRAAISSLGDTIKRPPSGVPSPDPLG